MGEIESSTINVLENMKFYLETSYNDLISDYECTAKGERMERKFLEGRLYQISILINIIEKDIQFRESLQDEAELKSGSRTTTNK